MKGVEGMTKPSPALAVRRLFCFVAITISTTGCQDGPDLVEVEGVVMLDGQPLEGATVTFRPIEGRPSFGTTDAEGHYSLAYTLEKPGALAGGHSVSITTLRAASDDAPRRFVKDRVPPRYNTESTLRVVVEPGQKTHDFTLVTK